MDILIYQGYAFVDIGKSYYICIGTEEEVKGASDSEIAEMIRTAIAMSQYNTLEMTTGLTLQ